MCATLRQTCTLTALLRLPWLMLTFVFGANLLEVLRSEPWRTMQSASFKCKHESRGRIFVVVCVPWRADQSLIAKLCANYDLDIIYSLWERLPWPIRRLITQSATQPGIINVWIDILYKNNGCDEFQEVRVPDWLVGRTFGDAARATDAAVPCGVTLASGVLKVNPPDSFELGSDDKLLMLGQPVAGKTFGGLDKAVLEGSKPAAKPPKIPAAVIKRERRGRNILVIGWDPTNIESTISGFAEFSPPGSLLERMITVRILFRSSYSAS